MYINKLMEKAKENKKTICLVETNDIRTLEAASIVKKEEFANIILVGDEVNINNIAKTNKIDLGDIKIINISDDNYPAKLKNIYAPPITIFAKGDISLLSSKAIAIVGSREPSKYGIYVAEKFSKELSKEGIAIVSGLAKGIDTFAHVGALSSFGKTIAVLGSGIDVVYPKENAKYYREISEKGLIISEYIVGTAPESKNFPQRNRIISGLSDGVLVVEARKNSGTMITTDFALEQGKELYVIPGNITSNLSAGTNNLIKEGAKLVTDVYEILEDLNC